MLSLNTQKNSEEIKLKYERHPKSFISNPKDIETIRLINQMMDEIIDSDFKTDFLENFTSNYQKESLLDSIYYTYYEKIENNIINKNYFEVFRILNAIFFVLENFNTWSFELERNSYKDLFENLTFYFNHCIIASIFYSKFSFQKEKFDDLKESIKNLIFEVLTFSEFLSENLNLKTIDIFNLSEFNTLLTFSKEELINISLELNKSNVDMYNSSLRFFSCSKNHELFEIAERKNIFYLEKCNKISNYIFN